jgi:hypothetical protein
MPAPVTLLMAAFAPRALVIFSDIFTGFFDLLRPQVFSASRRSEKQTGSAPEQSA